VSVPMPVSGESGLIAPTGFAALALPSPRDSPAACQEQKTEDEHDCRRVSKPSVYPA
jgi:hypothetical protein